MLSLCSPQRWDIPDMIDVHVDVIVVLKVILQIRDPWCWCQCRDQNCPLQMRYPWCWCHSCPPPDGISLMMLPSKLSSLQMGHPRRARHQERGALQPRDGREQTQVRGEPHNIIRRKMLGKANDDFLVVEFSARSNFSVNKLWVKFSRLFVLSLDFYAKIAHHKLQLLSGWRENDKLFADIIDNFVVDKYCWHNFWQIVYKF